MSLLGNGFSKTPLPPRYTLKNFPPLFNHHPAPNATFMQTSTIKRHFN
jgi:hypothetical protein